MKRLLAGACAAALLATSIGAAPAAAASRAELTFWRSAERGGTVADYEAYLERYPAGDFAALAKNRISDQTVSEAAPPPPAVPVNPALVEGALHLGTAERMAVQENLTRRGFDTRGVDGVFGPATRGAIREWQLEFGAAPTGYLTAEDYDEITAAPYSGATPQTEPVTARAEDDGPRVERRAAEAELGYGPKELAEIEARLAFAGFDPGHPDGVVDRETRRAIHDYRESRGFTPHRFLDRPMVDRLVADTAAWRGGSASSQTGIDPSVAAAVGLGALAVGGAILLDD